MGIFDFLSGEFIDVIHWVDDSRDTMVWRFEREGHEIKYGAKLTVREGQAAVFVHEGQLADVFTPGLYMLETNNMPVMTTLQHWDHGFKSPFKSEIYYVNTTRFNDLKWGTKNPIIVRDPEFGPVRLRAYGTYSVRVSDPARFLTEIVGTDGEFTMDEISYQIRNIIVQEFSRTIARAQIPVLDMAANTRELSKLVGTEIAAQLAEYGLAMPELYIENISLPPAVEDVLDKRSSMGVIGNLNEYMQFQAAEALGRDGAGAAAIQAGLGAGLGMQIGQAAAQAGPWGARPQVAAAPAAAHIPPPPPPVEHVWHIAVDGETTGPFSKAAMGRKAADGSLSRETYVWTPGQDGWQRAEDVAELAQLFTVLPPPPPGA
ncbi:SPFH domain-containing protein [Sulfitobacter mediterraneus]|uniref:SPFH domain-containing protein n=1 Tax=Sulfitobacter mediterraneus TaxID=83219 RepID=UPI00193A2592|nr:SPFH domain-containing protein [Sulfitobacter mediterraneus]MBM1556341.1 SPFH domain-containing protein [Sulfitobacter mediterraneus]MBM1567621.1 SPFH domain-containing protein [Sulfitobacter mediterraneus]MBM1571695.1 SPFH domain-containing protein [Sulfitobacter mediterraneus]MBM1575483.1 SPFH domain-containing protein [Sulfitobacter mediterraneus]MBM1579026.1 SPFH domain-containing protein [Sulfitobacter mediterraneus]